MDCHEEVAVLERRLWRLPGLEDLSADVVTQRLRVKYDAARLSTSAIAAAVAETGMRAWLEHDRPVGLPVSAWTRQVLLIASGSCLALGSAMRLAGVSSSLVWPVFAAAILTGGVFTARRAFSAARTFSLDINVLMLLAVVGAVAIGEWFEAAMVVFLFALAQRLESRTLDRVRGAIRTLMDLTPVETLVRRDSRERRLSVDEVRVGDVIVIRPGEKVPLDGRVVAGESHVNQAPLTGESLPVWKRTGDEVLAGTINGRGALEVERLRRDTTLTRVIQLVESAQGQRAPTQAFVERFARYYTPAVIALAAGFAVVPPLRECAKLS